MIIRWLCECKNPKTGNHTTLGFIEDKKIVRIKRDDLYVEVEGGRVTVNCVYCGKRHTLEQEPEKEETKSKSEGGE